VPGEALTLGRLTSDKQSLLAQTGAALTTSFFSGDSELWDRILSGKGDSL